MEGSTSEADRWWGYYGGGASWGRMGGGNEEIQFHGERCSLLVLGGGSGEKMEGVGLGRGGRGFGADNGACLGPQQSGGGGDCGRREGGMGVEKVWGGMRVEALKALAH